MCCWVTEVAAHEISAHATIKGSTSVVWWVVGMMREGAYPCVGCRQW
jgi:hypothetical protein